MKKVHWFFSSTTLSILSILSLLLSPLIALGFWFFHGSLSGLSSMMGGSINIIAYLVFIPLCFKIPTYLNARKLLLRLYLAEGLKLFISLVLFTLAFQWSKLRAFPFLVTFMASQTTCWLIPAMIRNKD